DFGIFVQLLPGIDGLVHISDLSWTEHIEHPGDIYKKADSVEAVVLGIDKANKKISLGIKQLSQDPWGQIEQDYPVSSMVEGEVSKITNFGAFIKLPSGIEGLVHISEVADHTVNKVEDVLKVGQKAQFRVISVNKEERKLGLSLKSKEASETKATENKERQKPAKSKEPKAAAPTGKARNIFQQELEKYAARKKGTGSDDSESEPSSSSEEQE
ncbi:MAG TPA: S1 RNA-binding domain-containing protein, partial [Rhabdochlamydiaceae bacterium]